jgi:hypothetical protein
LGLNAYLVQASDCTAFTPSLGLFHDGAQRSRIT